MAAPIRLREDYRAKVLRVLARESRDANHTRRLLSLAEIYDGGTRTQAARIGGVGLQVIRDWVLLQHRWPERPDRSQGAGQGSHP